VAPWFAALDPADWELVDDDDRSALDDIWDPLLGDRRTELVFIGIEMDEPEIRRILDACVLTDEEFAGGFESWSKFEDLLPPWDLSCDL
jgi:hypothetical protein